MFRRIIAIVVALLAVLPAAAAAAQTPPAPPNDNRANATALGTLPARVTGTTAGATVEPNEPFTGCGQTAGSVWYQLTVGSTVPAGIAVTLTASGDLDAVVDVYTKVRSQISSVECDATDKQGDAALSFTPQKNTTYLIRVSQLSDSVSGTFTLNAFVLPAPASPPGKPLPAGGAGGALERVVNTSAAYAVRMTAGVPYRINLVNRSTGCMGLEVFAPGTTSFNGDTPIARLPCGGYRLFTPSQSGTFSMLVRASGGARAQQRYYLDVAPASPPETAPGVFIGNDVSVFGRLRGNRIDVVRLYAFDVIDVSNLQLNLATGSGNTFDLELLNDRGNQIDCACGSSGGESINRTMHPGHYFAAVISRGFSSGSFTLSRLSRSITRTALLFNGTGFISGLPGTSLQMQVRVSKNISGPVSILVQRFDPLAGWQFDETINTTAVNGLAGATFIPTTAGRWRAIASFNGTRTASPSQSSYAEALLAGPLVQ
jgi:hypothetical protein